MRKKIKVTFLDRDGIFKKYKKKFNLRKPSIGMFKKKLVKFGKLINNNHL